LLPGSWVQEQRAGAEGEILGASDVHASRCYYSAAYCAEQQEQAPPTLRAGKSASTSGVTAGANMPPMTKLRMHGRVEQAR